MNAPATTTGPALLSDPSVRGIRVVDDGSPLVDATPEESDGACCFDAPGISGEARLLRSVLAQALRRAGLVNYPTEWWHWSFGDRYWAHVTGAPFAIHGPLDPPLD